MFDVFKFDLIEWDIEIQLEQFVIVSPALFSELSAKTYRHDLFQKIIRLSICWHLLLCRNWSWKGILLIRLHCIPFIRSLASNELITTFIVYFKNRRNFMNIRTSVYSIWHWTCAALRSFRLIKYLKCHQLWSFLYCLLFTCEIVLETIFSLNIETNNVCPWHYICYQP